MHSRADARRPHALAAALLAAICLCGALAPLQGRAQNVGDAPSEDEIARAVDALRADPNLSGEREVRVLRWNADEQRQPAQSSGFLRWIAGFFTWLAQLSRVFVWVVGGMLALALAGLVLRMVRSREPLGTSARLNVPTHVRDLDIRPESLPDDIGAAALALWHGGEHRAALALLYRGLLSRLAHVHQAPIRDSSTEGDCLALASRHLPADRRDYVARLIDVWQRAVYGGRDPHVDEIEALAAGFDAALAAPDTGSAP